MWIRAFTRVYGVTSGFKCETGLAFSTTPYVCNAYDIRLERCTRRSPTKDSQLSHWAFNMGFGCSMTSTIGTMLLRR